MLSKIEKPSTANTLFELSTLKKQLETLPNENYEDTLEYIKKQVKTDFDELGDLKHIILDSLEAGVFEKAGVNEIINHLTELIKMEGDAYKNKLEEIKSLVENKKVEKQSQATQAVAPAEKKQHK